MNSLFATVHRKALSDMASRAPECLRKDGAGAGQGVSRGIGGGVIDSGSETAAGPGGVTSVLSGGGAATGGEGAGVAGKDRRWSCQ
jgi:hypothetical protein